MSTCVCTCASVCMCLCACACVCACVRVHVYAYCASMRLRLCMRVCVCECAHLLVRECARRVMLTTHMTTSKSQTCQHVGRFSHRGKWIAHRSDSKRDFRQKCTLHPNELCPMYRKECQYQKREKKNKSHWKYIHAHECMCMCMCVHFSSAADIRPCEWHVHTVSEEHYVCFPNLFVICWHIRVLHFKLR